jgi:hypothetical protein
MRLFRRFHYGVLGSSAKPPVRRTYERTWLRSASFRYYWIYSGYLIIPIGRGSSTAHMPLGPALFKKERMNIPSKFIGYLSTCAFLRYAGAQKKPTHTRRKDWYEPQCVDS